jgi:hypothetical protein
MQSTSSFFIKFKIDFIQSLLLIVVYLFINIPKNLSRYSGLIKQAFSIFHEAL